MGTSSDTKNRKHGHIQNIRLLCRFPNGSLWISPDFLPGLSPRPGQERTSKTALSWSILHIPTFFVPFKSPSDQHSIHFQVLANFLRDFPALKSLTIAIRLPKPVLFNRGSAKHLMGFREFYRFRYGSLFCKENDFLLQYVDASLVNCFFRSPLPCRIQTPSRTVN